MAEPVETTDDKTPTNESVEPAVAPDETPAGADQPSGEGASDEPGEGADDLIDAAGEVGDGGASGDEKRNRERQPYDGPVAAVMLTSDGERCRPVVLHAKDISVGGICLISRSMIHPDSRGAIQLIRSDGVRVVVGVQVRFCRYAGSMNHETGMEFTAVPEGLNAGAFVDERGRPVIDVLVAEDDRRIA